MGRIIIEILFLLGVIGIVLGHPKVDKNPLNKVIQFYRAEGIRGGLAPSESTENESLEHPQSIKSYRLDLSNGRASDVVVVEEEDDSQEAPGKSFESVEVIFQNSEKINKNLVQFNSEPPISNEIDGDEESTTLPPQAEEKSDIFASSCEEGDVHKIDCNSCICISGAFICSKVNCAEKKKYHLKSKGSTPPPAPEDIGDQTTLPPPDCSDGSTKPVECNQCICALGRWACTKRSCIALTLREKASYNNNSKLFIDKADTLKEHPNLDEDCSEGQTRSLGCNQCICDIHNSWSCTELECPPPNGPNMTHVYEDNCQTEGGVKAKDCNLCTCTMGVWVCQTNDCQKLGVKERPRKPLFPISLVEELAHPKL